MHDFHDCLLHTQYKGRMAGLAGSPGTARRISPSCSQATTHGASSVTSTTPPGSITGSPAPGVYRRAPSPPTRPCTQAEPSRNLSRPRRREPTYWLDCDEPLMG